MTTPSSDTVLVTGAAGFIGSHLCSALIARGQRVVGIDNFHSFYAQPIKRRNAALVGLGTDQCPLLEIDICDAHAVRAAFEAHRPRAVVHLAARAGVRPSIADPVGYAHTNITGTAVLLDQATRAGCDRFIQASSSSVYGNCPTAPFREDMDVSEPISPYAATKRANELQCFTHHRLTGMPTACLRFFTVFGPRQRPDLAIQQFLLAAAADRPISMFGDGSTSRDFTYVGDIVAGILASLDRIPRHGYRIWNLGSDRPVTLSDLIDRIGKVRGKPMQVERKPKQEGDVERTWADLSRAAAELEYAPRTSLDQGLAKQWEFIRQS